MGKIAKREMLNPVRLPYVRRPFKDSDIIPESCPHHQAVQYPRGGRNRRESIAGTSRVGMFCLIRMEGERAVLAAPGRCGCDKDFFVVDAWEV